MKRIINWWRARQRQTDIQILWPVCKKYAYDLKHARATFFLHASMDLAWICLGEEEIVRIISALE